MCLFSISVYTYENNSYVNRHFDWIGKYAVSWCEPGLRTVSLFLENPWGTTQNKWACERDRERNVRAAQTLTCFAFFPTDFRRKERLGSQSSESRVDSEWKPINFGNSRVNRVIRVTCLKLERCFCSIQIPTYLSTIKEASLYRHCVPTAVEELRKWQTVGQPPSIYTLRVHVVP